MKLKSKAPKKTIIVAIVVAVVLVICAILLVVGLLNNNSIKDGDSITKILVSIPPKTTYYVGESFDPTGIQVQVITKDFALSYMVDHTQLEFSGFDSSVENESLPIIVTHKGVSTILDVTIKLPENSETPFLTSIEVCNLKTNYTLFYWTEYGISNYGATIKCTYSDGTVKEVPLEYSNIYDAVEIDTVGEHEITIKYRDAGITQETKVTITITN